MKKKILIITTGGTIAMKDDDGKGAKPALTGQDLINLVPQIGQIADIELFEFCNLPSPSITPDIMFELSKISQQKLHCFDGIVITHGTDTLEETSYFMHLTLDTTKPVVFTCAMRSNKEIGLDGPRNIMNAVRIAVDDQSRERGVLLAINDEIFCPREVYKSSTNLANAFDAPGYGKLGIVDVDKVIFHRRSEIIEKYFTDKIETKVDLIKIAAGSTAKFIEHSVNCGSKGIIIEAFGRGNVTPDVQKGIEFAIKNKIIVVITSRVPNGRVLSVYAYEGGAKKLEELGAIMGNDLNSEKARLKLMILLGKGFSYDEIKTAFQNEYENLTFG